MSLVCLVCLLVAVFLQAEMLQTITPHDPPCRRAAEEVAWSYSLYMHRMLSCSPRLCLSGVGAMCWQQGGHTVLGLAPWLLVQELREAGGVGGEQNAVELSGGAGPVVCTRMCMHMRTYISICIENYTFNKSPRVCCLFSTV